MSSYWLNLFLHFSGYTFKLKQKIFQADKISVILGNSLLLLISEFGFLIISLPMYIIVPPSKIQEEGVIFPKKFKVPEEFVSYTVRRRVSLITVLSTGGLFLLKFIFIGIVSTYLMGAQTLLAATQDWTFDNSADYTFDTAKVEVTSGQARLKSISTVYSGTTTNPGFDTTTTGWIYADWSDPNNVDVTGARQASGGNPGAYPNFNITITKKNLTGSGYWYQSFTTDVVSPTTATLNLDWKSIAISTVTLPATYKLYAFIDNSSAAPTIGTEVWSSGEITSSTSWNSIAAVDISGKLTATGTYYLKFAAYATSPNTQATYNYISGFDNIGVSWSKTVNSFAVGSPEIYPVNSLIPTDVIGWNAFTETATKNGGSINYQLSSDDGVTWQYWNGSAWTNAVSTSTANSSIVINSNISSFPATSGKIKWKAYLVGNGAQQVILDNVTVGYTQNSAPNISNVTVSQNASTGFAVVNYNLVDSDNDACSLVNYEYSLNGAFNGEQHAMTAATGDPAHQGVSGLSSSSGGVAHTFVWNAVADLGNIYATTVYVRLRAYDGIVNSGYTTSSVFTLDYVSPVVSGVAAVQNFGSGNISIGYNLFDDTTDNISVRLLISSDGGATWSVPTTTVSGDVGSSIVSGSGKSISWNSTVDFGDQEENDMLVSIGAVDKFNNQGSYVSSSAFILDNKAPRIATLVDLIAQPNAGDASVLLGGSFNESNPNTNEFYVALNNEAYGSAFNGDEDTANPANVNVPAGATLLGDDFVSAVKITHTDDFGYSFSNESLLPSASLRYVKPYTPPAPSVSVYSESSVGVTIGKYSSEVDGLEYAIYESTTDQYVQNDGSLGASPYWQNVGSVEVINLSAPLSQYVFQVKSRNISDVTNAPTSESALSSGASSEYQAQNIIINSVTQNNSGEKYVIINYTGLDYANDTNNLTISEYSTDNIEWHAMTEKDGVGSSGVSALPFTTGGANLVFAWDIAVDLPDAEDSAVYVRLQSNNGTSDSNLVVSSAFGVDTKNPIISNLLVSQTSLTDNITAVYDLADSSVMVIIFAISDDNGATWNVATTSYSGDVGSGVTAGAKSFTWNAAVDYVNQESNDIKMKLTAVDSLGNQSTVIESDSFSLDTKAPVISGVSAGQIADTALVQVDYTLVDLSSSTVLFAISDDNGATWNVATTSYSGDVGSGVTAGAKSFTWNAAVDFPDQESDTIKVRVQAIDNFGHQSNVLESASFSVNSRMLSISDINVAQNLGNKIVTISYDLNKTADIGLAISSDGGVTWNVNTSTASGAIGASILSGNDLTVTWNAGINFNNEEKTNMRVRLTGVDELGPPGHSYESVNFSLDTASPLGLISLNKFSNTTTTVTVLWQAVTDAYFNHYELWHGTSQTDVENRNGTASKWDVSNDINLTNPLTISTIISGINLVNDYFVKIWAIDDYNNEKTIPAINVYETLTSTTPEVVTGGGIGSSMETTPPNKPILNPLPTPSRETTFRISGLADANSVIELYDNDVLVSRLSDLSNGYGAFSQEFNFGLGDHVLKVLAIDSALNMSDFSEGVVLKVVSALVLPMTPIILTPRDNSSITESSPEFIGVADANNTIIIKIDNDSFTVVSDSNGAWSLKLPNTFALVDGPHTVSTMAVNEENTQSETMFITINKITPVREPVVAPPISQPTSGENILPTPSVSSNGGVVSVPAGGVGTPLPSAVLVKEVEEAEELIGIPVPKVTTASASVSPDGDLFSFSGTSVPNSDVVVYIHSDQALVYSTRADEKGDWQVNHSQTVSELSPGQHTVYAVTLDADENVKSQPSAVSSFTVKRNFWVMAFERLNWQTTTATLCVLLFAIFWLYRLRKKQA